MSGTDAIVINTRERASSGDINDIQSLKDRTLLSSWFESFQLRSYALGVAPGEVSQPVVLGGLEVGPSGVDIAVQDGVLLQDSTTLLPVPGTLDTSYRWSANRVQTVISNPAPGANTWFLIEAQMSEVVANATARDIFDPGTGLFVSTLVDKRTERQIVFQLVAGSATNLPLPSGGDWVVIGGVFVASGGGAIPSASFLDMRSLVEDLASSVRPAAASGLRTSSFEVITDPTTFPPLVAMDAEAWVQGRRLWFDTQVSGVDLFTNAAPWREPGTNPDAVNTLSYLFLCPLQNVGTRAIPVRNAYPSPIGGMNGNAILLWTTNPPDAGRYKNSTALALPAPFANYVVPIGGAVCVAAIHTDAGGTPVPMGPRGDNWQALYGNNFSITGTPWIDSIAPTGSGTGDPISIAAPVCARDVEVLIEWTRDAAGTANQNLFVQPTAGNALNRWWEVTMEGNVGGSARFIIPRRTAFEIGFTGATPPASATVTLVGWSL